MADELNDMLNSSPETSFLGKPSPTPKPTPRPSRFSMTDRMNSALAQAFKYARPASLLPPDPLSAAMRGQQSGQFTLPAVSANMLAEVPPSLRYNMPFNFATPQPRGSFLQSFAPPPSPAVMRWNEWRKRDTPGYSASQNFGF